MKRLLFAAGLGLLVFASGALALEAFVAWGKPVGATGVRYELWRDRGGWHLRWTGAGSFHHFFGKIWAPGGEVFLLRRHRLERGDRVWREGRGIRFDALAVGGWDGFDFRWRGKRLILDLEIDGRPCRRRIYIGADGVHPRTQPFSIVRGPRAGKPYRFYCCFGFSM
ncbi:MAG TPA: hypothetical protein ENF44_00380 [Deltaproteobacteria bacterium]|nr:hypothetical protein [Deltaproteobacteria bacterium]